MRGLGAGLYEVSGCDTTVRYVCGDGICLRETEPAPQVASQSPSPPPAVEDPRGVQVGSANGQRGVRLTLLDGTKKLYVIGVPAIDSDHVTIDGGQTPEGCSAYMLKTRTETVRVPTSDPRVSIEQLRTIAPDLLSIELCGARLRVLNRGLQDLALFLERFDEVKANPTAPVEEGDGREPEAVSPDALVRAHINAHRTALLACLGGAAGAVAARWDEDGLTFTVSGQPDDAPVQGCVRAAIGQLELPQGSEGQLLHPVVP